MPKVTVIDGDTREMAGELAAYFMKRFEDCSWEQSQDAVTLVLQRYLETATPEQMEEVLSVVRGQALISQEEWEVLANNADGGMIVKIDDDEQYSAVLSSLHAKGLIQWRDTQRRDYKISQYGLRRWSALMSAFVRSNPSADI
jgi:hypothetical protein